MYIGECSAWIPLAVCKRTLALPLGLTHVVRAAGLMPMIAATSLLIFLTILAPFSRTLASKSTSGLFIQPVTDTPNNASRSKIFLDTGERNLKSV